MTLSERVAAEKVARGCPDAFIWAYAYGFSEQECKQVKGESQCVELIPFPSKNKRVVITRVQYR